MTEEIAQKTNWIIITLIVFFVLFAIAIAFYPAIKKSATEKQCTIEIMKASTASKSAFAPKDFTTAHCQATNLGELTTTKSSKIAKIIIDEAGRCWKKFGEGQKNPLPGELLIQDRHCYTCAKFSMPSIATPSIPLDKALDSQLSINDDARALLSSAFLSENGQTMYGIQSAKVETIKEDGKEKEGLEAEKWDIELKSGEVYYLLNIFVINKNLPGLWALAGFTTQDTFSKLALVSEQNINNVCTQMWN